MLLSLALETNLNRFMESTKMLKGLAMVLDQHCLLYFLNMGMKQRSYDVKLSPQKKQKKQHEDSKPKDLFEKCEDDYCPLPTQQVS